MPPPVVEEENILIQERRNVLCMGKIEVEIEFFLHPTVQSLNNWIICRSSPSRHGTKYVIMAVGLAKSLGRVDSSLVGVQDYLGLLLFLFACKSVEDSKAFIVWFVAAGDVGDTVREDLVVEGIQQDRPFPVFPSNLEHGHV